MDQLLNVPTDHLPGFYDEIYGFTDEEQHRALRSQTLSLRPYKKPDVSWNGVYLGKTWRDMRGCTNDDKKMNFCLFRRGLISLKELDEDAPSWGWRRHGNEISPQDTRVEVRRGHHLARKIDGKKTLHLEEDKKGGGGLKRVGDSQFEYNAQLGSVFSRMGS